MAVAAPRPVRRQAVFRPRHREWVRPDRGHHRPRVGLSAGPRRAGAPAALHDTEQYANNRVEADQCRLKARLRPTRGTKTLRGVRTLARGHAFVQNLRRGPYEIATETIARHRLRGAFDELVVAI
jgi:hypothetical protein